MSEEPLWAISDEWEQYIYEYYMKEKLERKDKDLDKEQE
jgi:hypothetical protein